MNKNNRPDVVCDFNDTPHREIDGGHPQGLRVCKNPRPVEYITLRFAFGRGQYDFTRITREGYKTPAWNTVAKVVREWMQSNEEFRAWAQKHEGIFLAGHDISDSRSYYGSVVNTFSRVNYLRFSNETHGRTFHIPLIREKI